MIEAIERSKDPLRKQCTTYWGMSSKKVIILGDMNGTVKIK